MPNSTKSDSADQTVRLTKREVEILILFVEGKSRQAVADILHVSRRTVDFHLGNVYAKLNVCNLLQALLKADRLKLIILGSYEM